MNRKDDINPETPLSEEKLNEMEADGADEEQGDPEITEELSETEGLALKVEEVTDQLHRSLAENENLRKRHRRELEERTKYAVTDLALELLGVIDNLERALEGAPDDQIDDPLVKGVSLVLEQLRVTLANHGVTAVETEGKEFDPNFHEAMAEDPRDDMEPNMITGEYVRGYMIGDRLLRAAKVTVSVSGTPPKKGE